MYGYPELFPESPVHIPVADEYNNPLANGAAQWHQTAYVPRCLVVQLGENNVFNVKSGVHIRKE